MDILLWGFFRMDTAGIWLSALVWIRARLNCFNQTNISDLNVFVNVYVTIFHLWINIEVQLSACVSL